jgi:hypothetical protein
MKWIPVGKKKIMEKRGKKKRVGRVCKLKSRRVARV